MTGTVHAAQRRTASRPTFEVRLHGRGGQGVVTAAELLSVAAFKDGLEAQAFPSFGSERMGAPVVSFCRIDERPIRRRVTELPQFVVDRVETDSDRIRPAASEVGRLLAGTALAQELWGWEPAYTLDQALDETIAWVRDNLALFRVDTYTT